MLGAIIGDIVGSKYEFNNIKTKDFKLFDNDMLFTDDTVLTVAIYEALKECNGNYKNLGEYAKKTITKYVELYPYKSYGGMFLDWISTPNQLKKPYNSFGNGAAMRVSPVAFFANSISEVKELSRKVTEITHNHKEGIKGAEATAVAIYLALQGCSKDEIKKEMQKYYDFNFTIEKIKNSYSFNETCMHTVPQALEVFFESLNFEDCIRLGISLGGDSDTLCAIAGSVAEAYYGIPKNIKNQAYTYLDDNILNKVCEFYENCKYEKIK